MGGKAGGDRPGVGGMVDIVNGGLGEDKQEEKSFHVKRSKQTTCEAVKRKRWLLRETKNLKENSGKKRRNRNTQKGEGNKIQLKNR